PSRAHDPRPPAAIPVGGSGSRPATSPHDATSPESRRNMSTITNEQELLARVPGGLFIGGKWIDAEEGRTFDVRDPSTGDVIASIADATPADGIRALDAAVAAQQEWAATAPRTRSDILRRAFDLVQAHKEDLA